MTNIENKEQLDKIITAVKAYEEATKKRAAVEVLVQDKLTVLKNALGSASPNGPLVHEEAKRLIGEYFISNPPLGD